MIVQGAGLLGSNFMQNMTLRERAAVYAIGLWFATDLGVAASGAMRVASLGATGAIWSSAVLEMVDRVTEIAGGSVWGQTPRRSQT